MTELQDILIQSDEDNMKNAIDVGGFNLIPVKRETSIKLLFWLTISSNVLPIDPVDPNIAIFFFILK